MTFTRKYLVLGSVLGLSLAACGSDDADGGGGTAGSGGDTQCPDCLVPPAAPANGATGDGDGTVLAARKWYFGDTTRAGASDPNAWKKFGYDLDGLKSTRTSTNHCKLAEGASDSVKTDGDNGIDNSFGPNIMPIMTGINPQFATLINDNVTAGFFAMILEIEKVGTGADYVNLPAALYFGANVGEIVGSPPKWDGSDVWPVYCDLMTDCKASGTMQLDGGNQSTVKFPNSYMTGRTWVSGPGSVVTMTLLVGGVTFSLKITKAVITAELNATNTGGTNGVIAGILDTEQVVSTISQLAGRISTSLCDGSALDEVKNSIRKASDIMSDGTQNPNATCNGITVGLGFDLAPVQLGAVLDESEVTPDPCE
jgi:hypothetical protein